MTCRRRQPLQGGQQARLPAATARRSCPVRAKWRWMVHVHLQGLGPVLQRGVVGGCFWMCWQIPAGAGRWARAAAARPCGAARPAAGAPRDRRGCRPRARTRSGWPPAVVRAAAAPPVLRTPHPAVAVQSPVPRTGCACAPRRCSPPHAPCRPEPRSRGWRARPSGHPRAPPSGRTWRRPVGDGDAGVARCGYRAGSAGRGWSPGGVPALRSTARSRGSGRECPFAIGHDPNAAEGSGAHRSMRGSPPT